MKQNIVLGTSFSPEYCEYLGSKNPLEILRIVDGRLKIKDVRLGLRWNRVEREGKISLDYYDRYIGYLLKNDFKVSLNIGPIKVFRWPEEHIPKYLEQCKVSVVSPESELAKYSYEYLHKLLKVLENEYGSKLDNVTFQLENESFNRFGHLKMIMSERYLVELFKILKEYFPSNMVMVDSAGRKDLYRVISLLKILIGKDIVKGEDFVIGLNYYFRLPNLFKREPLKELAPWYMSISKLHSLQNQLGFGLEISEGQFEPWGKKITPGNSLDDFKYLLEKCYTYFPEGYKYKLVRLWGIEEFGMRVINKQLSQEHKKILQEIIS